jgi:alpha-tubulin suppressor-like RCC1 family protein
VNIENGTSALFGKTVVAIAAGLYHSLAVCSDGTLAAWGYNRNSQLGDATVTDRNTPTAVYNGNSFSALFGKTVVV